MITSPLTPNRALGILGIALGLSAFTLPQARAASGTWTNLSGGSWTNALNWSGGVIADAATFNANFGTLNLTADTTVTLDASRSIGSMTFDDTTPSHNWFLNTGTAGTLTLAGATPTITVNNQSNTINLVMAGTVGMTKAGAGTLILGGANTYTGGTTVNGGVLQIGTGLVGNTATAPITNNSQLVYLKGDATAVTIASPITGNGTLVLNGTIYPSSGQFVLSVTNSFTGPVILNQARMYEGNGGAPRFGRPSMINVLAGSGILVGIANNFTNPISIAGTGWRENTAPNFLGALRLSAGANWTGPITLTANARIHAVNAAGVVTGPISGPYELELSGSSTTVTLTLGSPANSTSATRISNLGTTLNVIVTNANALSTGPLTMAGGTLKLSGVNMSFSNLSTVFNAAAASQIQNGHASTSSTMTVGSDNSTTTFAGVFSDGGSAPLYLTKVGTGTLTLTGNSSLSGATLVTNGKLFIQGASAGFSGSGPVAVFTGGTFGDSGSVSGILDVLNGGSILASGLNAVPLTCYNAVNFGTAATDLTTNSINVSLGGKLAVSSTVTVNGTNIINIIGSSPTVGVHDLITSPAAIGGAGFAGFRLGSLPPGTVATLQDSGTGVQLNVTASGTEPKTWKGDIAAVWNPAAGNEWLGQTSSTAQPYAQFDNVTFNDEATNFTVNLTANVTPSLLTVNNSASNYTFNGTGGIGGNVTFTKTGDGMLTINTTNSFTTPLAIYGGTVTVARVSNAGVNSPLGSGNSVDMNLGGTLEVTEANGSMNRTINLVGEGTIKTDNTLTLSGFTVGTGKLTKTGSGKLILTGVGFHSGGTVISSGTLQIGDGSFYLGGLVGNVENNGTLTLNRVESTANLILPGDLSGNGVVNFYGTGLPLQGRYQSTGNNSGFAGTVLIDNSRVQIATQAQLGSPSLITITNNGQILFFCAAPPAAPVEFNNAYLISGIGWSEGFPANYGALRMINALLSGPITLAGNSRITAIGSVGYITGPISQSGGSWKLELGQKEANQNNGTMLLANSNSYTGGTDIRGAVVLGVSNSCLGSGPITMDEGFATATITRLDVFGDVTITNAMTLDSIAATGTRGVIAATNGLAILSGPITITAAANNGGHFASDSVTLSTLRVTGPILTPTGITPNAFVGTVEVGGGGTYTNFIHGGGVLRLLANNGINSGSSLNLGSTTASTFDLNGFNQAVTGLTKGASTSTTTNAAGTASTVTLNAPGTNTYAGSLRGNLAFTLGSGTFTLSAANDYTGATAVNGGTLLVTGNITGGGAVTVASGARLGGTGLIGGATTIQSGGTLAPGTSVGTLTVTNTVTLAAGSTTVAEIHRNTATPAADLLTGVTTLNYGGTLVITNIGTNTLRSGDVYNLFDATTFNPGFSSVITPPLLPGLSWNTNLNTDGTMSISGTVIPPQFNPTAVSGSSLTFTGTGGLAGARYVVLTSTNVGLPLLSWTPLITNTFGGGGTFGFGDTVNPALPRRFYTIAIP